MLSPAQLENLRRFENGGDFRTEASFRTALKSLRTSEELHYLVQLMNWDDSKTKSALRWVIDQPNCDAGTALHIYWVNEPAFWKRAEAAKNIPAWGHDAYELHQEVERRFLAGRFSTGAIAFDPRKEKYLSDLPSRESLEEQAIPTKLKEATPGATLPDYYDLPPS